MGQALRRATIITTSYFVPFLSETPEKSKVYGSAETEVLVMKIPCLEARLPEGIESIHMATTLEMQSKFLKACGRKVWHIGPLFLNEIGAKQRARRGMEASIEEHGYLKWLDSKKSDSVVYVSFGSVANFTDDQLMEIAVGLEALGQQFIWLVKKEKREWVVREECDGI